MSSIHHCIHTGFNGDLSDFRDDDPSAGRKISYVDEGVDEGLDGMGIVIAWPLQQHGMVVPWFAVIDAWMGPVFVSLS